MRAIYFPKDGDIYFRNYYTMKALKLDAARSGVEGIFVVNSEQFFVRGRHKWRVVKPQEFRTWRQSRYLDSLWYAEEVVGPQEEVFI